MKEILKDELRMSKKLRIIVTISTIIFCISSIVISYELYKAINEVVSKRAVNSITNISELNVDSVSREIENTRILLETFADNISAQESVDVEKVLNEMRPYVKTHGFYNMGIMTEDFKLYLTSGEKLDVKGRPEFEDAWSDKFHMSESYLPAQGGVYMINMLSCPVYYDGTHEYTVTAAVYSKDLTKRMNISSMGGRGYNILINTEGKVVIFPKHYGSAEYNNLMDFVNRTPGFIPEDNGNRFFEFHDISYYAHFEKLGINDWYLMTCAKRKDVFAEADIIIDSVFVGLGMMWMMIILALMATVYSMYRSRERRKAAVFYDEMLGIENGNCLPVFFEKTNDEERKQFVLVNFDIDNFKEFNYIYGEDVGDELLKYIVRAFKEELPEDYLVRYHADNFVALLKCKGKQQVREKIERLFGRFSWDIEKGEVHPFDVSAGIRRAREGNSFGRVMSDALLAKGMVKGNHMQKYAFYDDDLRHRRMKYMEMESGFLKALRNDEFKVYYQPKYDMQTGKIIGAEALVRWIKPEGGMISPGEFIPCFESSRQIVLLDEAVLETVCRDMKEMKAKGIDVKKVSVNLSRVHLRQTGILPKIEEIVKISGVAPEKLSFEITESVLYEDSIPLKNIIETIHNIGCKVDIDDYGMGVSGPNALASNEFDSVKLDKSFIDGIGDSKIEAVIRSTIILSKELGMEIIAEGVEEKYQIDSLVKWGCTLAQGFYYSRPVPKEKYIEMLIENSKNND